MPLKFLTISHPHGIAAEYWGMRGATSPESRSTGCLSKAPTPRQVRHRLPQLFTAAVRRRGHVRQELQRSNPPGRGPRLARRRARRRGHHLDREPAQRRSRANSSLDQYLAVEKGLGAATRRSNIVLGVGDDTPTPGTRFRTARRDAASVNSSRRSRPSITSSAASSSRTTRQGREGSGGATLGQSVIDDVRDDCNRLRTRLAPVEQQKMDQQLASIRDLEKTSHHHVGRGLLVRADAARPATIPADLTKLMRFNGGEPTFDVVTTLFVDMLAQAFACDITRFGTLVLNDLPWDSATTPRPTRSARACHPTSTTRWRTSTRPWLRLGRQAGRPGDADHLAPPGQVQQVRLRQGRAVDAEARRLGALDNILIYATSEIGNPSVTHRPRCRPCWRGAPTCRSEFGRRFKLTPDCAPPNDSCKPHDPKFAIGANNHLLVSIAQAFGVRTDSVWQRPQQHLHHRSPLGPDLILAVTGSARKPSDARWPC